MKLKLILFLLTLTTSLIFGQTEKEIENGIFVTFPTNPQYQANADATSYIATTDNCIFMGMVLRSQIPNYPQYVQARKKWTTSEIKMVEDSFLDNAVKGKLDYIGKQNSSSSEIKIGDFRGRKMEYSAINPVTGERGKRFSIMLLVRDKVVSFECWYLIDNESSRIEKDSFLKSISLKK